MKYNVKTVIDAKYADNGDKKEKPYSDNVIFIKENSGTSVVGTYGALGKGRTEMRFHPSYQSLTFEHEMGHVIGHRDLYWDNGLEPPDRRTVPVSGYSGNLMSDRRPILQWWNAEEIMGLHGIKPPLYKLNLYPPFITVKPPPGTF